MTYPYQKPSRSGWEVAAKSSADPPGPQIGNRKWKGGANSPLWCQIIADVTGKPVFRAATSEAAALGAAILATAGLGLHPDVQSAARAMTGLDSRSFIPVPERRVFYERLYRDVYRFLFPSLQKYLDALDDLSFSAGDSPTRP